MKLEKTPCAFLIVILIIAFTAFTMPFSLASPGTKIYVDPPLIIDEGKSPSETYDIYYLSATSLTGFGADYRKLVTTTGTADTTTSVKNAKNYGVRFYFDPFTTDSIAIGTPSASTLKGYGWRSDGVYGKTIPSGTWQFNLTLTSSSASGNGHIEIWVYKCTTTGGSVSKLFSIDATGTNVLATTTATKYTFTYWAPVYDLTSYVLVIEYWLHVTTAGTNSNGNVALTAVSAASSVRSAPLGTDITVDTMVADVTDLFSWQVTIYYNATILNVTDVSLPPNHVFADPEKYLYLGPYTLLSSGYVQVGVTLLWVDPLTTFDGTGVLCRITFHVKGRGYTPLHFSPYGPDTFLQDRNWHIITASTEDGFYEYKYAIVNLEVKPNRYLADRLETFNVSVWLNNVTESDRVIGAQFRLKYNATLLEVQKVTEGQFFKQFGNTSSVNYTILSENDDPKNYIKYGSHIYVGIVILASDGQYAKFPNGSGILATVTFRGIDRSFYKALNSPLELKDVIVVDDTRPEPNVVATINPINGYYEISPMQASPMLKVQPEVYEAKKKDESFQINVNICNLDADAQLKSVEFKLTYNATVLEVLNTTEGSFLQSFGKTAFNYSVGSGSITIQNGLETLFAGFPNGNGTIATIAFKAIRRSFYPEETNSTLNLTEIVLLDVHQNEIPTSAPMNGFYKINSLRLPVANFTYSPSTPLETQEVVFNASASDDPDGLIVSYIWDFGDGNTTTVTSSVITHSYMAPGTYNVTLTVIDDDGLSDGDAKTVIVEAQPGILLYAVIIMVLATIVIVAAIVTYYKRIRKYKSRTV